MKALHFLIALALITSIACSSEESNNPGQNMYFPPATGSEWETTSPSDLGWNESQVRALIDFLEEKRSKSFLILVNGRIVMEEYFDGHSASDTWQ